MISISHIQVQNDFVIGVNLEVMRSSLSPAARPSAPRPSSLSLPQTFREQAPSVKHWTVIGLPTTAPRDSTHPGKLVSRIAVNCSASYFPLPDSPKWLAVVVPTLPSPTPSHHPGHLSPINHHISPLPVQLACANSLLAQALSYAPSAAPLPASTPTRPQTSAPCACATSSSTRAPSPTPPSPSSTLAAPASRRSRPTSQRAPLRAAGAATSAGGTLQRMFRATSRSLVWCRSCSAPPSGRGQMLFL